MTLRPGLHCDIDESVYHADPCETPSINASTAKRLLSHSPYHAALQHPRLQGGRQEREPSQGMIEGRLLHAIVLQQPVEWCVVVDAEDWRTKSAREQRDAALAEGRTPILQRAYDAVLAEAADLLEQVPPGSQLLEPCDREITAIWLDEYGCLCRGRLDLLSTIEIGDLKRLRGATPHNLGSLVARYGYHIQAAAYVEAIESLFPARAGRVSFTFHVWSDGHYFEAQLSEAAMTAGRSEWARAKRLWTQCLRSGQWPRWADQGPVIVDLPAWAMMGVYDDE